VSDIAEKFTNGNLVNFGEGNGFKKSSTAVVEKHSRESQQMAMAEFCATFDELDINSVEDEVRLIRKGRRRLSVESLSEKVQKAWDNS